MTKTKKQTTGAAEKNTDKMTRRVRTDAKQTNSGGIDQRDINAAAWAACDTFRGVVDPAQYKDYILVILFLRYISDIWQDHYDEYKKEYGDDDERIRRKLERERFVLPVIPITEETDEYEKDRKTKKRKVVDTFTASFYSLYDRRDRPNIGELINITLEHIEEANRAKLAGVFRNIDFNSEANLGKTKDRNRRLKQLLEDFDSDKLCMKPSRVSEDIIGNTYIYLIERFASDSGKKAGEFFTPLMVTELVAKLANPQEGNTVCDPACGSGGLLIQAAHQIPSGNVALFGQETNGSTWALCRMNMFLHSFDSARIEWGDTLNNPLLVSGDSLMQFDIVMANPPFSLDKWGAENAEKDQYRRFTRGIPPKSKGDWAFITHMVETTKPQKGRVAVVVPHGVLFRGGSELAIRQAMIEENILDAVIGLPANLFPTTGIPVAILVFDKAREKGGAREKQTDVIFIDASHEFIQGKKQNTLSPDQLEKVLKTYRTRENVDKYSRKVLFKELRDNEFNLNIPRYVDTYEEEPEIDIDAVQQDIDRLETELTGIRKQMKEKLAKIQRK
jgi:type I restriction enzyme M protein